MLPFGRMAQTFSGAGAGSTIGRRAIRRRTSGIRVRRTRAGRAGRCGRTRSARAGRCGTPCPSCSWAPWPRRCSTSPARSSRRRPSARRGPRPRHPIRARPPATASRASSARGCSARGDLAHRHGPGADDLPRRRGRHRERHRGTVRALHGIRARAQRPRLVVAHLPRTGAQAHRFEPCRARGIARRSGLASGATRSSQATPSRASPTDSASRRSPCSPPTRSAGTASSTPGRRSPSRGSASCRPHRGPGA